MFLSLGGGGERVYFLFFFPERKKQHDIENPKPVFFLGGEGKGTVGFFSK